MGSKRKAINFNEILIVASSKALVSNSKHCYTTSKAPVTTSVALVTTIQTGMKQLHSCILP